MLIIVFPAAFCSFVESADGYPLYEDPNTTFFQMIYFVFISMTFIGYGSYVSSEVGKVFLTLFLTYRPLLFPPHLALPPLSY